MHKVAPIFVTRDSACSLAWAKIFPEVGWVLFSSKHLYSRFWHLTVLQSNVFALNCRANSVINFLSGMMRVSWDYLWRTWGNTTRAHNNYMTEFKLERHTITHYNMIICAGTLLRCFRWPFGCFRRPAVGMVVSVEIVTKFNLLFVHQTIQWGRKPKM